MKPERPISEFLTLIVGLKFVTNFIVKDINYKYDNVWYELLIVIIALLCIRYFVKCVFTIFEYVVDYIKWRKLK